jgi:hypothetical protein
MLFCPLLFGISAAPLAGGRLFSFPSPNPYFRRIIVHKEI